MNLKSLTFSNFQKIHNAGYSLDMVFLLLNDDQSSVKDYCKESPKLGALYQSLMRKGLVTEDGKITLTGKELLKFMDEPQQEATTVKKRVVVSGFDAWWKAYPGTDTFVHKDKKFEGTRSLRTKKDDCKAKFNKILEEGEYTAEEMIEALEYEVLQKKENSVKTKTNRMTYMQNSLTYLNQRGFESYIELVRAGIKQPETKEAQGGVDI